MSKSYVELLKDPRWQRRRLEILERSDFSCENCEAIDKTLHVHHKKYRKGAMPWEYEDSELEALCENCHSNLHRLRDELSQAISQLDEYELERVLGYAETILAWHHSKDPEQILHFKGAGHVLGIADVLGFSHEVYCALLAGKDNQIAVGDMDIIRGVVATNAKGRQQ